MSSSCHDLSALGTTTNTTTTTTTPALNDSPRRRSVMATIGAESDMLTHFNKPEVRKSHIAGYSRYHHIAMSYGITQCYLTPSSSDFPDFTPAEAGTRFSDPGGMQG